MVSTGHRPIGGSAEEDLAGGPEQAGVFYYSIKDCGGGSISA